MAWAWLLLACGVLIIDQLNKKLLASLLPLGEDIAVTRFFSLVHVLNPGAAFSFLADADGWQAPALSALGILASLWMASEILRRRAVGLERPAYAFVIGGALGNVLDRLLQGAVTDFLDFHRGGWHWPVFNLADVAINIGGSLILIAAFRKAL